MAAKSPPNHPKTMLTILKKIYAGTRAHGFGYFAILLKNEITQPRYRFTRHVRELLILARRILGRGGKGNALHTNCLQFCYDLSTSPITFDFASYLAAAEIERRLRRLEGIEIVFVMNQAGGVREETPEYEAAVNREARLWRLRNMLLPMMAFLPTIRSISICTREQAETFVSQDPRHLYPSDYRVFLPRQPDKRVIHEHARAGVPIWPMFRASEHSRRLVAEYLEREAKGRKTIVITLRNYGYTPQRNSRNEDWLAFADSLDPTRYAPIFVHDSETVMQPPPADFSRHLVFEAASVNLEIRMALYEAAWLNMALMAGPTELCWYNERARYLFFIAIGSAAVQTEEALVRNGHRVGFDLDFAKPYQRIVWEVDDVKVLKREFAAMEALLDELDSTWPLTAFEPERPYADQVQGQPR